MTWERAKLETEILVEQWRRRRRREERVATVVCFVLLLAVLALLDLALRMP